ncbi:hypothetical protein GQ53DRAFT_838734 [Thozetella sp. PMI_491]|nr:hypothetical protein GQ53DRAFT_838734 [Thozetella sp. PMI_491]
MSSTSLSSASSPFEIKLTGTGVSIRPAERAILNLKAESLQTSTPVEASEQVTTVANLIREIISPYCPQEDVAGAPKTDAGISHYSMTTLETSCHYHQARTDQGVTTEASTTYSARAEFNIKFSSFAVLNQLATRFSAMENISIKRLSWHLTNDTADSLKSGTRKKAALDAIQRARDYAEVFCNLTAEEAVARVKPISLTEHANYSHSTRPQLHYGKKERAAKVDEKELQFEPEDVSVEVRVDARFHVEELQQS